MHEVRVENSQTIQLASLIESVVDGDEITFTKNDRPVAKLVAVKQEKPRPVFGSAKGLFELAGDFDAPLDDFDEYRK